VKELVEIKIKMPGRVNFSYYYADRGGKKKQLELLEKALKNIKLHFEQDEEGK